MKILLLLMVAAFVGTAPAQIQPYTHTSGNITVQVMPFQSMPLSLPGTPPNVRYGLFAYASGATDADAVEVTIRYVGADGKLMERSQPVPIGGTAFFAVGVVRSIDRVSLRPIYYTSAEVARISSGCVLWFSTAVYPPTEPTCIKRGYGEQE